jgi:hypothetical protein
MLLVQAAAVTIKQEEVQLRFSSLLRLPEFQKTPSEMVQLETPALMEGWDTGSVRVEEVLAIMGEVEAVQEAKRAAENLIVAA